MNFIYFVTHFPTKSQCWWRGNYNSCVIVSPYQFMQVNDGVPVTSLSASLQHNTGAATFHLYQISLNRKLSRIIYAGSRQTKSTLVDLWNTKWMNESRKFEKWCKFLSRVIDKTRKKRPSSIIIHSKTDLLRTVSVWMRMHKYIYYLWNRGLGGKTDRIKKKSEVLTVFIRLGTGTRCGLLCTRSRKFVGYWLNISTLTASQDGLYFIM
jgi:hypothetical protein